MNTIHPTSWCMFTLVAGMLWLPHGAHAGEASVARGEYLTQLLGCGRCHTEGELVGRRDGVWLAGSTTGIAYTPYDQDEQPGVVFAGNLTPDPQTGLGQWSEDDIIRLIRSGTDHNDGMRLTVMPWPAYGLLNDADARAIADYLRSLDPVINEIPENVPEGTPTDAAYVRFSIYRFVPGRSPKVVPTP